MTTFATIEDLRESLARPTPRHSPEYVAKMMHEVPESTVVDREKFILERCKGQVVLDIGASGAMHIAIVGIAKRTFGITKPDKPDVVSCAMPSDEQMANETEVTFGINLDYHGTWIPQCPEVSLVVCGEVLEHLSNQGWFLDRLKMVYPRVPTIFTVPNAFSEAGRRHILEGCENVNIDHTCWFSHRTLTTLLGRHGYVIEEFHWYKGDPFTAEGLIAVCGYQG